MIRTDLAIQIGRLAVDNDHCSVTFVHAFVEIPSPLYIGPGRNGHPMVKEFLMKHRGQYNCPSIVVSLMFNAQVVMSFDCGRTKTGFLTV